MTGKVFCEVRRIWALAAGMAVLLLASAGPAQDMFDHGFVEPCTMSNVAEMHLECEVCPSAPGSRQCEERLKPRGFTRKCRTRGGHSAWEEIWCAPRPKPQVTSIGTWGVVLGALCTVGAMALVMRVISGKPKP